jgi:Ca-activated chloride channel family protein
VGVGGSRGLVNVPFPMTNPATQKTVYIRRLMSLPVDEKLLQTIAQRTRGKYFLATDPESLQRIFQEIDRLEKTPLRVQRYVRYREAFPPLAWAGLGLLILPFATALLRITAEP